MQMRTPKSHSFVPNCTVLFDQLTHSGWLLWNCSDWLVTYANEDMAAQLQLDSKVLVPLVQIQYQEFLYEVRSGAQCRKLGSSVCGFPWHAVCVRAFCNQWLLDSGYKFGPTSSQRAFVGRYSSSRFTLFKMALQGSPPYLALKIATAQSSVYIFSYFRP